MVYEHVLTDTASIGAIFENIHKTRAPGWRRKRISRTLVKIIALINVRVSAAFLADQHGHDR